MCWCYRLLNWKMHGETLKFTFTFTLFRNVGKNSQKHGATFQKRSRLNHTVATTSYVARNLLFCANECPKRLLYEDGKPGIIVTTCCIRHTGLIYLFIADNTSLTANELYTTNLECREESKHSKAGFDVFRAVWLRTEACRDKTCATG